MKKSYSSQIQNFGLQDRDSEAEKRFRFFALVHKMRIKIAALALLIAFAIPIYAQNPTYLNESFTGSSAPTGWVSSTFTFNDGAILAAGASGALTTPALDLSAYANDPTVSFTSAFASGNGNVTVSWSDGTDTYTVAFYNGLTGTGTKSFVLPTTAITDGFQMSITVDNTNGGVFTLTNVTVEDVAVPGGEPLLYEQFTSSPFPPTGWTILSGLASDAFSGTNPTSGGSWTRNAAYVYTDGHAKSNIYGDSRKEWLVTPTISLTPNCVMEFAAAFTDYGNADAPENVGDDDKFMVIVSTDNGTTWAEANATIWDNTGTDYTLSSVPNTGQTYTIDLSTYSGDIKIALYAESTVSNADNDFRVDYVKVYTPLACATPTAPVVSNITTSGATINWGEVSSAAYNLAYSTDPTNWTTIYGITGNTDYALSGLIDGTFYYIKVQADCGGSGTSEWSSTVSFNTPRDCGGSTIPVTPIVGTGASMTYITPFYSYASSSYAQGWSWQIYTKDELNDLGAYACNIYALGLQHVTSEAFTVPMQMYIAHTDKASFADADDYIDLSTMTKVFDGTYTFSNTTDWSMIPFDAPFAYNGTDNIVVAFYRPAPQVTALQYFKYTTAIDKVIFRYGDESATLATSSGTQYYYRNNMRFDMCTTVPTCLKPTLFAQNGAPTAYTIPLRMYSNSGTPQGVQVKFTAEGDPVDVASFTTGNDTIYFTVSGLKADTTYTVYARLKCGESDFSPWADNYVSRTTLNDNTDFTAMAISDPAGSQVGTTAIDATAHTINMVLGAGYAAQINSLKLTFSTEDASAQVKIGDVVQVSGTTANDFTNPVTYTVLAEDPNVSQTWTVTVTVTVETCPSIVDLDENAAPTARRAAYYFECFDNTQTLWNVRLTKNPNTPEAETTYSVIDKADITTYDSIRGDTIVFAHFELTGYNDYTDYECSVQADCGGGDVSAYYATPYAFTTPPTCYTPTAFVASNIERRSATISWTAGRTETAWNVKVSETNTDHPETLDPSLVVFSQNNTLTTTCDLTQLDRETTYYAYIQASCGGDDGNSHWLQGSFTTAGLPSDCSSGIPAGSELIADGSTTNSNVPVYGNYCDAKQRSQSIYPAAMLTNLVGKTIDSLHYFVSSGSSANWSTLTFKVSIGTTSQENLSSGWATDAVTQVYEGTLSASVANGMGIKLDNPFVYNGGNLLVCFQLDISGGYTSCNFCGTNPTGRSRYIQGSNYLTGAGTEQSFLPKVEMFYCPNVPACPAISAESVTGQLTGEGTTTGTISWGAYDPTADYPSGYDLIYCPEPITDFSAITNASIGDTILVLNTTSGIELTGLSTYTDYYAYVRVRCENDPDQQASEWVGGHVFKTNAICRVPINLAYTVHNTTSVTVSWQDGSDTQDNSFQFVYANEELATPLFSGAGQTGLSKILTGLTPETQYWFYLRNDCGGDDGQSPYISITFTTPATCPAPLNLSARDVTANAVTLDWERGDFGEETAWNVVYLPTASTDSTTDHNVVNVSNLNQLVLQGLTPETEYKAYVQAYCDAEHQSDWTGPVVFETTAVPMNCTSFDGNGSTTQGNMVTDTYYNYTWSQQIFTADELTAAGLTAGTMTSLSVQYFHASNITRTMKLYLGNTTKSTFTSTTDWFDVSTLTNVYDQSTTFSNDDPWFPFVFATPFTWDGTSNIVVCFVDATGTYQTNASKFYQHTGVSNNTLYKTQDQPMSMSVAGDLMSGRANIQFCFVPPTCPAITHIEVVGITTDAALVQWYRAKNETSWNFNYSTTPLEDPSVGAIALTDPYKDLTGLTLDQQYYVYVQADCGSGDLSEWTEYTFYTLPNCSQPTLAVSSITDATAVLTCTNGTYGSTQTYDYEYWLRGSTDTIKIYGAGATVTLGTENNATDLPLFAMTYYEYRAKVNCLGDQGCSRWTDVAEFKTLCGVYTNLPFAEGFEANSGTLDCWTRVDADDDGYNWNFVSAGVTLHSGSYVATSASYANYAGALTPDNWLISPAIALTANKQLSWWITAQDVDYYLEHYAVYIIHNNLQDTSTVLEETLPATNWQQRVVKLRDYADDTIKVAFRHYNCTDQYQINLDDVSVEDIPACSPPFGLITESVLSNSARISWNVGDNETAWEVIVATEKLSTPAQFGAYTPITANTNSNFEITGLNGGTEYWVYARSTCSAELHSAWSTEKLSFTTLCPQTLLPITEMLPSGDLPDCWQEQIVEAGANGFIENLQFALGAIEFENEENYVGAKTRLVSLPISTEDSTDVQVSFYMPHFSTPGFDDKGIVLQYSYNTVDWVSVDTIVRHSDIAMEKEHVYKVAGFDNQPNLFIGFLFENDGSNLYTVLYAPIKVEVAPSCPKPLGLYVENITDLTADLRWEGNLGEATYNIIVSETYSDSPDTLAVTYSGVSATGTYGYSLAGLDEQTTYYVWVQSVCGADRSAFSNCISFTTECSVKTITDEVPYTENFDSYTGTNFYNYSVMPACWDNVFTGTSPTYAPHVCNSMYHSSPNSLGMCTSSSTSYSNGDGKVYVFLPEFTNNLKDLHISFWSRKSSATYGVLSLGYVTGDDVANFVEMNEFSVTTTMAEYSYSISDFVPDIPAGARLAYRYYNGSSSAYNCTIDDVVVRLIETNTNIATYSATTAQGTAWGVVDTENHRVDVQLLYGYAADADITPAVTLEGEYATISPTPTTLKWHNISTSADTTINYTVTAESGAEQPWSVHLLVEACASPNTLTSTQSGPQNLGFSWENPDGPSEWHFYLSETQMTQAQLNALTASDYTTLYAKSHSLTSFSYSTQYYWYVRSTCGGATNSFWVAGTPFTTWVFCEPPSDITINVVDDGEIELNWTPFEDMPMGGTYTITREGAEPATGITGSSYTEASLAMGATYSYTITSICSEANPSVASSAVTIYVPNCKVPTDLLLDSITTTEAFISWTRKNGEESWSVVIDGVETAIGTDDVAIDVDTVTYTIDGLLSNASHTFKVKSVCGENEESAYTAQIDFTTNIEPATIPYAHGFEAAAVDENRNWVILNGTQTNQWFMGEASPNDGAQSLYISNDGGATNAYSNDAASYVYAVRNFDSLHVATNYNIAFNWKAQGENSWDLLRVFMVPQSVSLSAGNASGMDGSTNTTPSGWIDLTSGKLNLQSSWQFLRKSFTVTTDDLYKLVIFWKNDNNGGSNPPASIDNIRIYSCIDTTYLEPQAVCYGSGYYENGFDLDDADIAEGENTYSIYTGGEFSANGCERVKTIVLTQLPELITNQTATVCEGEIYNLDGWNINTTDSTAGVHSYSRLTTSVYGSCDSTINLQLTVLARSSSVDVQTACESYTWIDGVTYTESNNTATFTLTNAAGCDSIVTLDFTILKNTGTEVVTACDSYTWNGVTYTSSTNTPTDTLQNIAGCDSIVTLNLTIIESPIVPTANATNSTTCMGAGDGTITVTAPLGAEYEYSIDGENYQTAVLFDELVDGDYTLSVRRIGTACANSAVITVGSTVTRPDAIASSNSPVCLGDAIALSGEGSATGEDITYAWTGPEGFTSSLMNPVEIADATAANAGVYTLVVTNNTTVCNRTVTTTVVVNQPSTGIDVQEHCDSYTWIDGVTYTESNNTATHTLTNVVGCDSVVTLNLTIKNSNTGIDVQEHCDSYTWIDGVTYTESNNTATFTVENAAGCDSVVTLNLTINHSNTGVDVQSACGGYQWIDGVTYFESTNTPTWTLTNAAGCDSVVTLNLTISNGSTGTDVQEHCDSYTWINGVTYTQSTNTPTWFLQDVAGCDSIVTLNLTINHSTSAIDEQLSCTGSFTWIDGVTYTQSTDSATFTIPNAVGCDSVITLHLTVGTENTGTDTQVACDSYTWIDGVTYTESTNTPTFTLTNVTGCDSVVTLNLTIKNSTTSVDVQEHCDSYTWIDDVTYTESNNTATFTLTNAAGCDSVITLNLTIGHDNEGIDVQEHCGSYTWIDGVTYTESTNTPTWTLTNATGCDSVVTLNLTIHELPTIVITGDSIVVEGQSVTLVASGAETYVWSTEETTAEITVQPVVDTEYSVVGTDANGCIGTQSHYIHVVTGIEGVEAASFTMYPNPANSMLTVKGQNMERIELYNAVGKLVSTTQCSNQNESTLTVEGYTPGLYIVKVYTNNNESYSLKLVVER